MDHDASNYTVERAIVELAARVSQTDLVEMIDRAAKLGILDQAWFDELVWRVTNRQAASRACAAMDTWLARA
jgi:hypothetical protein